MWIIFTLYYGPIKNLGFLSDRNFFNDAQLSFVQFPLWYLKMLHSIENVWTCIIDTCQP